MSTKTFNTRLRLKYDTYANWSTNNPILLSGELAIVVVTSGVSTSILMKVGDGSQRFNALPYVSGLASDVYEWAKTATKPTYSANEISGLADYISGEINDTNTRYKIEQDSADASKIYFYHREVTDSDWILDKTITVSTENTEYTFAEGTTNGAFSVTPTGGTAQSVSIHGLGTAAYSNATAFDTAGAATTALSNAKDYTDQQINAKIASVFKYKGTVGSYSALPSTGNTEGDVYHVSDTHMEYVWVKVDGYASPSWEELGTVVDLTDYAKTSDVNNALANKVDANNPIAGATHTKITYDTKGLVTGGSDLTASDIPNLTTSKITGLDTALSGKATKGNITASSAAKMVTYNSEGIVTGGRDIQSSDLTGVSLGMSQITGLDTALSNKTDDADLATIAKTGNANDLVQTSGDYLILYCGTATEII